MEKVVFKLTTGDLILAHLVSNSAEILCVMNPMVVNYYNDPNQESSRTLMYLSLLNPLFSKKEEYVFEKIHVVFQTKVDEDIGNFFDKYITTKDDEEKSASVGKKYKLDNFVLDKNKKLN